MELTREQLFNQIWAEPMGTVAARYGITGNGLARICDRLNIPRPSRSHWTRAAENRDPVPELPAPPRGLSEVVAFGQKLPRRSPGTRTRMDAESRRRQLMDVAARIALAEGIAAVDMKRLAREVGISEAQVHNCFGGRIDLLTALARREISDLEARRRERVGRSADRHTAVVISTIGYLHEAAERGPLLQMLLRVTEVKEALRKQRAETAAKAQAPILSRLTGKGEMSIEQARASTVALSAVALRAGGIVSAGRAPFALVEELCVSVVMAGVHSDDQFAH